MRRKMKSVKVRKKRMEERNYSKTTNQEVFYKGKEIYKFKFKGNRRKEQKKE